MKIKSILYLLAFISLPNYLKAQNIFDEKFSNCNTDHFVIESDTISVYPKTGIENTLILHIEREILEKIQGLLSLQIIINEKGESCLISIKNKTNIPTEKLKLKNIIDGNLKWNIPDKKTAVIIKLKFNKGKVGFTRYGINSAKGFHKLTN